MGSVCTKTGERVCQAALGHDCGFSCQCMTCGSGDKCDCSCRWLVVAGFAIFVLSSWIAYISWKEKRKWLFTWSSIYAVSSAVLTLVTHSRGPDSHEWYGCSVPLSMWSLFLFISTTAYYTSDYMHRGQQEGERMERYVYDPKKGEYVKSQTMREFHAV